MKLLRGILLMLGAGAVASAAEIPRVSLLEQEFSLVYVATREAYIVNEYVPPGETLKGWTRKLTIMHAPKTSQPAIAMRSLVRATQGSDQLANRSKVVGRDGVKEGDDIAVLLIFKDPVNGEVEYNLQRFAKEAGVPGVMSYQYSRHYPANATNLPAKEEVNAWLRALWAMQVPVQDKL